MEKKGNPLKLNLSDFREEGLYIILQDSRILRLTRKNIEKTAREYWKDPGRIPASVKKAVEFRRCPFCPLNKADDLCDALRPALPFLEEIDEFASFDPVTAVYRHGGDQGSLIVSETTMQEALKYVSLLSLMQYCQVGREYWPYYLGVTPIAGGEDVAARIYLNIYWSHKGDRETILKTVAAFMEHIKWTARNQVERMHLICRKDAFMNAFVNTRLDTVFLTWDEEIITKAFRRFRRKRVPHTKKEESDGRTG